MNSINIRKDFPYLKSLVNGKPPIYFDSAATTHKPVQVINTITEIYSKYNAPVNRSAYSSGGIATQLYLQAHENTARFIGARSYREIIFTKNSTEGINLLAYSLLHGDDKKFKISAGDEIILPLSEHHSDYVPWIRLSEISGVRIKNVPLTPEGVVDPDKIKSMITDKTRLICSAHVSNVMGMINPVKDISRLAENSGVLFLVDGTQSAPHIPVNVQEIGCDFFVFSGHKMLAPAGTGVLWAKEKILEKLPPFLSGGGMIKGVGPLSVSWNELPWKFEAGTPDMCGAVALSGAEITGSGIKLTGAIDYLNQLGMLNIHQHEQRLCGYALDKLGEIPEIKIYGSNSSEHRCGILSFNIYKNGELTDPHIAAEFLSADGIEIRAGGHCAYPLMGELGVPGTLRISFYIYNTADEIDIFIDSLKDIINNRLL